MIITQLPIFVFELLLWIDFYLWVFTNFKIIYYFNNEIVNILAIGQILNEKIYLYWKYCFHYIIEFMLFNKLSWSNTNIYITILTLQLKDTFSIIHKCL